MKRETLVWLVIFLLGALGLFWRAAVSDPGMSREYVKAVPIQGANWTKYESAEYIDYAQAQAADPAQVQYQLSLSRTVGVWVAAFFTLAIFSFLYKDNPFYKVAEAVLIGVSAAYWMVVGFWDVIVPNVVGKVAPMLVKNWAIPDLEQLNWDPWYLIPLVLSAMLLMRLSPVGSWIARWPLAFIIGTTAGLRLIAYLHGDFTAQIRNTIFPLIVMDNGAFDAAQSVRNIIIIVGMMACLVYFFFSFEHKGIVGKTARLGIWFLMITFGAGFGYTVMGRVTLLAQRLEFLFDDWLWLIDPTNKRTAVETLTAALGMLT